MTLQQQWGSVGMALALTTIVGVCGAGVAQTAISTTPPHVYDLTPAPREQVTGAFTAGTTGQTADAIARVALADREFTFTLNSPVMGHTDATGRVIGRLPTDVSLTQVVLYDIAEMGEASLSRANLPTLAVYNGDTFLGTANYDTKATAAAQEVTVNLADGSTVTLRPVVYSFTEPIAVNAETPYELRLNAAGVTPVLPLFANAASNAGFGIVNYTTWAPYVTFACRSTVNIESFPVNADTALSDLTYTDNNSTALVFTLDEGVTLTLNKRVRNATLIFETAAPAASAPTVAFAENVAFSTPFVFRNAKSSDNGAIRITGPWENSGTSDTNDTWSPSALTVDCDLVLASPLPFRDGNWFQGNKVRVLPGRTLRLETEANTPSRLPDVLLTAPTANLAFADTKKAAASAEKPSIPEKYLPLFTGTSGTITFERPVAFNYAGNENDSQGSLFRIGNQGDEGYAFTLNVDKNFSSLSRLVLGGDSGATTLNLRGDTTTTYAATINFDSNSALTQSAGNLTLGGGDGWATWFLGNSSTLVFGDGNTLNGTATATLNGIPYGSNDTTDYTGAADLTVKADATLLLNECDLPAVAGTPDYALYPVGKRSLKVQGGTVKANTGAAVTMVFENPEPQTAPMAVAEIPGLEVIGAANLESSDATNSSLSLDALKGNGDVTLSGIVHIGTVRIEAGKELDLDLRKGSDGADDAIGGSRVTIDAVTGTAGTIRFGLLGTNGTTGEQTVIDSLLAGGFTGTVGFLMPDYSTLDFEDTQLPALPFTLEVQPGQTVVMRLDQYADADILWPEDCSNVKLVLVEAGPFGGEATLPAWPQGVKMEFHRYDDSSDGHSALPVEDYDDTRNDDGLTIDLTWKNPVLDGKVAWVDVEFNGDSYNTGWFRIGSANGMLQGVGGIGTDEILDNNDDFTTTYNPAGEGVNPRHQPYIPVNALPAYPDSWSIVARVTAAEFTRTVMLAIGANYKDVTGGTGDDFSDRDTLVLATGSMKDHGDGGTIGADDDDDNAKDTIRLWLIRGRDLYGENPAVPTEYLAQASLPQVTEMPHLYTITYDNRHIQVYVDGHCLMDTTLPEDINLGPGLQIGKLMGGANIDGDHLSIGKVLAEQFKPVDSSTGDGVVDFIRIYRGILSDAAIDQLVRENPYIHKDPGGAASNHRDVRYVRVINGGADEPWVQKGAWQRQHLSLGGDLIWTNDDTYAEPAEGAIVVVQCREGNATLRVNTQKGELFPSADRTYSMLIVTGKDIDTLTQDEGVDDNWIGGTLTIAPYDDPSTPDNEWYTERTDDGAFRYGVLRFSGGAGQRVNQGHTTVTTFFNEGHSLAGYVLTHAVLHGSVIDLASDGVEIRRGVNATFRADDLITRGFDGEIFLRQLTGPLSGTEFYHYVSPAGDVYGYGSVIGNDDISSSNQQTSEFVWVPTFDNRESEWKLDDVTRANSEVLERETGFGSTVQLPQTGVFVRVAKVPGRLYLELNEDAVQGDGALSKQAWYRYGYHNDVAAETVSHMKPDPMHAGDFEKAVALSIRLENGETRTLRADSAANGLTVNELTIEKPKEDDGTANETLQILPQDGTDYSLKVMDAVSTERRLEVYSAQGAGSEVSTTGADGVRLVYETDPGSQERIGAKLYGIETGEFVAGNSTINHPLDGSSIARIESVGTVRFTAAQDLSATTVAAAKGATLEQTGVATETATAEQVGADNAFRAKAMELAQESRFVFASSAATVDEEITLTGAATLKGTGTAAKLTPTLGVAGQLGTETLTLAADENADWKLLNSEVGGLPLTKVGAGVADIATDLPPNAGFVDVQKGTLAVATGLAGEGQAVGQASLNVETGATLAPTSGTIAEDVLAEIPAGQTVSGLGRIDGTLRLETNATLDATKATATDDGSLSVRDVQTDGLTALADVGVSLPENTEEGLVFLRSDEEALNWTARARLLATTPNATRWDVLLRYRRNPENPEGTNYLVGAAGLDVPNPDGLPEDIRPGDDDLVDNEWPDGSGDDPAVDDEVTDQIQDGGNVAGEAEGYTKANTQWLMAPDIANAYACFGNVWTLAPRVLSADSEDYATRDLLMAYEFGISRMAFSQDGNHIVVEATLRNALAVCPYFDPTLLQGADKLKPTFLPGVTVAIVGPKGVIADAKEIDADEAKRNGFTPIETATETARWFLVPYNGTNFPEGTATNLNVRAIPPAEQTATPAR